MFPSGTLDTIISKYDQYPLFLSLFTGAVEPEKSKCFSHRTATAQPLGEGEVNGGESRKGTPVFSLKIYHKIILL